MSTSYAQGVRIEVGKRVTAVPKVCESVKPASIEAEIDIPGLVREAICKGAGDMLSDYTYVMTNTKRTIDKKGHIREESTVYEVYMPTLKGGTRGRGILLVTSKNGIPVPAAELEKERAKAGERLEKEQGKVESQTPSLPEKDTILTKGLMPIGMYPRTRSLKSSFGRTKADVALVVQTFLEKCELTFDHREQIDGHTTLVFNFKARSGAEFNDNERYIAKLHGKIWIDAAERIVTRLAGWPTSETSTMVTGIAPQSDESTPAVYVEMTRLPEGVWLSKTVRLNGADYRDLFEGIESDGTVSYSEYKRFTSEAQDVILDTPVKTP